MTGTYASLCSGIGGLDLAVEAVFSYQLAWHAEYADTPAAIHERHWPGVPNLHDLTVVDWASCEPVDLICAGYPCQPFSHAGARRGEDDARHLWPHIAEAVRVLRPRWVVLENVAGHLSLGLGTVLGDLAAAGYDTEWCCVRASDVGAPHGRLRLFILAADTDVRRCQVGPELDGQPDEAAADRHPRRGHTDRRGHPAADTSHLGHERGGQPRRRGATERALVAWGPYESAIRRWEATTRPAPRPTDHRGRLSPDFVEWMMGYPEGWTVGPRRNARLKALGNAVVPQQGTHALRILTEAWARRTEAAA